MNINILYIRVHELLVGQMERRKKGSRFSIHDDRD